MGRAGFAPNLRAARFGTCEYNFCILLSWLVYFASRVSQRTSACLRLALSRRLAGNTFIAAIFKCDDQSKQGAWGGCL